MTPVALGLVLISAVMHTSWNFFVKQAKYKQAFMWWALVVGSLCFTFVFFINPPLPARVWPYVAASAVMEALYCIALTWAYDIEDFSLTYPLARGTAPALLVIWAALFLGEPPRPVGLIGISLLILGLIIVGGGAILFRPGKVAFSPKGIIAALAAASCISIYSAIDGAAVRIAPAAPYTILVLGLSACLFAPAVFMRYGTQVMFAEWHLNWRRIILVGLVLILTYGIVLQVYAISRVSYAGSIREVSVVFAALFGWLWLGERFGPFRTIGSLLIFAGIVVIAVAG
ncbi:MAG TPA: EamA family transporter [Ktedonobacteraceae bacterium]|nr:EamA family transporter [Ktedonobacteraceae bacterium]